MIFTMGIVTRDIKFTVFLGTLCNIFSLSLNDLRGLQY